MSSFVPAADETAIRLAPRSIFVAARFESAEADVDAEIRTAVERAEARMQANLLDGFDHVYAEPTATLRAQRDELGRELAIAPAETTHG